MATEPKQSPEARLAQLERERALIVAALEECRAALSEGRDAAFIGGRLLGAVEAIVGPTASSTNYQQSESSITNDNGKRASSKQVLLTKRELCDCLGFKDIKTINALMRGKKIPFIKLGYKIVRFDLKKVQAALENFEARAAKLPSR